MRFQADARWANHGAGPPPKTLRTCGDNNRVGVHGDCTRPGQCSAIQRYASGECDGSLSHDGSGEGCGCAQGRGTSHLPEDVVSVGAIDEDDLAVSGGGGESGNDLEYPDRVRIAIAIEGEVSGYAEWRLRAGGFINSGKKFQPPDIGSKDSAAGCSRSIVVSGG